MFRTTFGKGFHIEFANGTCVSVQFGTGNYCERRNFCEPRNFEGGVYGGMLDDHPSNIWESPNAEVAIWYPGGKWATKDAWLAVFSEKLDDDVRGWCTPEQVARLIAWASN